MAYLGSEYAQQPFMDFYLQLACGTGEVGAILVDTVGHPSSSRLPMTAVVSEEGDAYDEVRLIYVERQDTLVPVFYRWVEEETDGSVVLHTIEALKDTGIDTTFAVLDADGYTGADIDALMEAEVAFLMRVDVDSACWEEVVSEHLDTLEADEFEAFCDGRRYYVKRFPCALGASRREAWDYLCAWMTR